MPFSLVATANDSTDALRSSMVTVEHTALREGSLADATLASEVQIAMAQRTQDGFKVDPTPSGCVVAKGAATTFRASRDTGSSILHVYEAVFIHREPGASGPAARTFLVIGGAFDARGQPMEEGVNTILATWSWLT